MAIRRQPGLAGLGSAAGRAAVYYARKKRLARLAGNGENPAGFNVTYLDNYQNVPSSTIVSLNLGDASTAPEWYLLLSCCDNFNSHTSFVVEEYNANSCLDQIFGNLLYAANGAGKKALATVFWFPPNGGGDTTFLWSSNANEQYNEIYSLGAQPDIAGISIDGNTGEVNFDISYADGSVSWAQGQGESATVTSALSGITISTPTTTVVRPNADNTWYQFGIDFETGTDTRNVAIDNNGSSDCQLRVGNFGVATESPITLTFEASVVDTASNSDPLFTLTGTPDPSDEWILVGFTDTYANTWSSFTTLGGQTLEPLARSRNSDGINIQVFYVTGLTSSTPQLFTNATNGVAAILLKVENWSKNGWFLKSQRENTNTGDDISAEIPEGGIGIACAHMTTADPANIELVGPDGFYANELAFETDTSVSVGYITGDGTLKSISISPDPSHLTSGNHAALFVMSP